MVLQDTTSANPRSLDGYKPAKPNIRMSQFLDESLPFLAITLESRKEELRDCNGEMSDLSDSLDDYMDAWYSEMSSISLANSDSRHTRRTAYIVPCPNLHPIPYDILKGLIEHSDGKVGLEVCTHLLQLDFLQLISSFLVKPPGRHFTFFCNRLTFSKGSRE
jgi:hypothetical protein